MPITVLNNNSGAQSLGHLLSGVNDIMRHNAANEQNQISIDQNAMAMRLKQRELGMAQDARIQDQANWGADDLFRHKKLNSVDIPTVGVNQQNANTNAGQLSLATEQWGVKRNLGDAFNPTMKGTAGVMNGMDPSQAAILSSGLYSDRATPEWSAPAQTANVADTVSQTALRNLESDKLRGAAADSARLDTTNESRWLSDTYPEVYRNRESLRKNVDFNQYMSEAARLLAEGETPPSWGQYADDAKRRSGLASAGVTDSGQGSESVENYRMKMRDAQDEAKLEMAKMSKLMDYVAAPGFNSGGPDAVVRGITAVQSLLRNLDMDGILSAETRSSLISEQAFDANQADLIIGMAKQLYPVSNNDLAMLQRMTGGRENTPEAIMEIIGGRYREAEGSYNRASEFGRQYAEARQTNDFSSLRVLDNNDSPEFQIPSTHRQAQQAETPPPDIVRQATAQNMDIENDLGQIWDFSNNQWVDR